MGKPYPLIKRGGVVEYSNIVERNGKIRRVFPFDSYDLKALAPCLASVEHHILKVPLLGQYVRDPSEDDQESGQHGGWCGRTSAAMVYNYFALIKWPNDTPKHYITQWDGDDGDYKVDLRYPNKKRAFNTRPTLFPNKYEGAPTLHGAIKDEAFSPPADPSVLTEGGPEGSADYAGIEQAFKYGRKLPNGAVETYSKTLYPGYTGAENIPRLEAAKQFASNPAYLESSFSLVKQSLLYLNPVIFRSGLGPYLRHMARHFVVICGFAYFEVGGEKSLWLAIADPAQCEIALICGHARSESWDSWKNDRDNRFIEDATKAFTLTKEHRIIQIVPGDWSRGQASFYLLKASALFEMHPECSFNLLLDNSEDPNGRFYHNAYEQLVHDVPPDVIDSTFTRPIFFPFTSPTEYCTPARLYALTETGNKDARGYFPFGPNRNLHTGVHLSPDAEPEEPPKPFSRIEQAAQTPPKEKSPDPPAREVCEPGKLVRVYAMAPGYIVALCVPNSVPPEFAPKANSDEGHNDNEIGALLMGNHGGFVLIRHQLEEVPQSQEGSQQGGQKGGAQSGAKAAKTYEFYSLYMHLAAPAKGCEDFYSGVPWRDKLTQGYGSVTVIDPVLPDYAAPRWARQPMGEASDLKPGPNDPGYDHGVGVMVKSGTIKLLGAPEPLKLEPKGPDQDQVVAVWKEPEADARAILESLQEGNVVTFTTPFLPVRAGDLLGFVERGVGRAGGFLHWEILAPEGGALEDILKFAENALAVKDEAPALKGFFSTFKPASGEVNYFDPDKKQLDDIVAQVHIRMAPIPGLIANYRKGNSHASAVLARSVGSPRPPWRGRCGGRIRPAAEGGDYQLRSPTNESGWHLLPVGCRLSKGEQSCVGSAGSERW